MGKALIQIHGHYGVGGKLELEVEAVPRTYYKSQVIIGGLGGFGLEQEWLRKY